MAFSCLKRVFLSRKVMNLPTAYGNFTMDYVNGMEKEKYC